MSGRARAPALGRSSPIGVLPARTPGHPRTRPPGKKAAPPVMEGMIGVMTATSTATEPAPAPPEPDKPADRAASQAIAAQQVRHAAARWLTSDHTTALGRQLASSIQTYQQQHGQAPTWADALTGVDPALLAPLRTVPEDWPYKPSRWRLELRQHLMSELRRTRGNSYTQTPAPCAPASRAAAGSAPPTPPRLVTVTVTAIKTRSHHLNSLPRPPPVRELRNQLIVSPHCGRRRSGSAAMIGAPGIPGDRHASEQPGSQQCMHNTPACRLRSTMPYGRLPTHHRDENRAGRSK
jgi:hypothetical protein